MYISQIVSMFIREIFAIVRSIKKQELTAPHLHRLCVLTYKQWIESFVDEFKSLICHRTIRGKSNIDGI